MYIFVDIYGFPVERDPINYPYSYDAFVIYMANDFNPNTDFRVYSDRVTNGHYSEQELSEACSQVTDREEISWRDPDQVGKFMSILRKKNMQCTAITQCCNFLNGYPYWCVYLRGS